MANGNDMRYTALMESEDATEFKDAADGVAFVIKSLNTYFDCVEKIRANDMWMLLEKGFSSFLDMPEDYFMGWVNRFDKALETFKRCFENIKGLNDQQVRIFMGRLIKTGIVSILMDIMKAATEAEEREMYFWNSDREMMENIDVKTKMNDVRRVVRRISEALDTEWLPSFMNLN